MSGEATNLLQQALNLPPDERYEFAQRLLDSLDSEDLLPDDPAVRAELERRLKSVEDGTAELIPWEQARENIRAELDRRRAARESGNQP
jgi:putative addiction module component (TIGR02574 family)